MLKRIGREFDLRLWGSMLGELYAQRDRENRDYLTYPEWNAEGIYYLRDHETTSTLSFRAAAVASGLVVAEDLEHLEEIVLRNRGQLPAASLAAKFRVSALDAMYRAAEAERAGVHPYHYAQRERAKALHEEAERKAVQLQIAVDAKRSVERAAETAKQTRVQSRTLRPAGRGVDIQEL